jgi:hypothetical protein
VRHGESGVVFEAANPESLLQTVRTAWQAPGMLQNLGQGARQAYDALYNEDANYQTLMQIYEQAMAQSSKDQIMKEDILGFQVVAQPPEACVDEVFECLEHEGRKAKLACLNPHSYAVALDDADFAGALRSADWLVPDGVGVVFASRLLGGAVKTRVTGSDVFEGLHARMNARKGMSVFFLGASEETLALICARMAVRTTRTSAWRAPIRPPSSRSIPRPSSTR